MPRYDRTYTGARFHKADLQVQTPADGHHWAEAATAIAAPADGTPINYGPTADAIIDRAREVGLELIAVTDHNFAAKPLLPALQEVAAATATTDYRLHVLPGFEIMADVGTGCHALAIFDADEDLEWIDHRLTECGVPPPRFNANGAIPSRRRLVDILTAVQEAKPASKRLRGVVILPHSQSDEGIFDNDRINTWLQAAEFTSPSLLCIEVPKPPSTMSQGWRSLLGNGADCHPEWRRIRPIACISSSDCKALRPGAHGQHYLGKRYTWIKYSEPSVEGLRQAFLDPESRIRLQEGDPELGYGQTFIRQLSVTGAQYLADFRVDFSANLNCIIGGGGTGKSSIVEYLRIALGQVAGIVGDATENLTRLKETLLPTTTVSLVVDLQGVRYTINSTGGAPGVVASTDGVELDVPTLFPVRVFSQREIYAIAGDAAARSRVLDNLIAAELSTLGADAADIVVRLREIDAGVSNRIGLQRRLLEARTAQQDFARRLGLLQQHEGPLAAWAADIAADAEVRRWHDEAGARANAMLEAAAFMTAVQAERGTDAGEAANGYVAIIQGMGAAIDEVARRAIEDIQSHSRSEITSGVRRRAEEAVVARQSRLIEQGADPGRLAEYFAGHGRASAQVADLSARLSEMETLDRERALALERLHGVWASETQARRVVSDRLRDVVPETSSGRPFIEATIHPFGDGAAIAATLMPYLRDRRRMSEEEWKRLANALLHASGEGRPPFAVLREWRAALSAGVHPDGFPWNVGGREAGVFLEWVDDDALRALELVRVPDRVSIALFRNDGSLAGEVDGGLSVGQRCTAILAVVLAMDDAPIIIDQPEDEVDNEFTFRELVPLIRRAKETRQVILATHDPNIPVNGDAELIMALESRSGRGSIRRSGGKECVGSLDQQHIQGAVEDIMEGSEEAFRRRYEKYGF